MFFSIYPVVFLLPMNHKLLGITKKADQEKKKD